MIKYSDLPVIPMPKHVEPEGKWEKKTIGRGISTTEESWKPAVEVFLGYAKRLYGLDFFEGKDIVLTRSAQELPKEGYRLDTRRETVLLETRDFAGANHALATLLQLLDSDGTLICTSVEDAPETSYRGVMVDLARKPHRLDEVLCYMDYCYLLKLNAIQLHFSDNEGYALPSYRFPKLTSPERGFRVDEIAVMNDYAKARGILIVPEVDLPGHCAAINGLYPECFANSAPVGESGVAELCGAAVNRDNVDDVLCVGRPGIFENIRALLGEVAELFPDSPFLHVGGDEVKYSIWENCPDCQRYMRENGISGAKSLYTHVVKKITDLVLEMGRTPIVWEGFPEEGAEEISKKVIVIAWESYYQTADRLVAQGFQIINCSWQPLYIVPSLCWKAEDILAWNIYNWQHWYEASYAHLNPIHLQPTPLVLGAQLCAWEGTFEQEMRAAKENLAALSERVWTIRRYCEDAQFRAKLERVLPLLDRIEKSRKCAEIRK